MSAMTNYMKIYQAYKYAWEKEEKSEGDKKS